jgi:hypothetical protein
MLIAQLAVVASGPDSAATCDTIRITAIARAEGEAAPQLTPPSGPGFQLLRSNVVTHHELDGTGRTLSIAEGSYLISFGVSGHVVVPAIVATLGTHRAAAAPIHLHIIGGEQADPIVLVSSTLDDGRRRVTDDTLFVGQQVDYVVDVQLNETARQRLRRNPTFFPPEMPSALAYDVTTAAHAVERGGPRCFATLSYRRALFPLFTGATTIPPATLAYGLPVSTSFFSREERFEQRTDSVRFVALEPPANGRADDYAGAVGVVHASAHLDGTSPRMGDPLVLTLRLAGTGNVKLWPRPALTVDWASIANGDERVDVDSTRSRVQGTKEFDWLLTPTRAGPRVVPVIRYPYFDPERAAYDVAITDTISLDIAAASLATADTVVVPRLAIRHVLRDARAPALPAQPWFWLLLAAAPVPATMRRVTRRRRVRKAGVAPGRRLQQLASASTQLPARELRRLFLDALRERIPALTLTTTQSPLGRQLRRAGVTAATADAAEALLNRLDDAAFSPRGDTDAALAPSAAAVARAVAEEAMRPRTGNGALVILVTGSLLLSASVAFATSASALRSFADGVQAYERKQPVAAERLFARAAADAPRASDAWANFGAAAWTANDSARAAFGWQRALRLDPLDAESRERLSALGPLAVTANGYVPPLPGDALAGTALVLWVAAWLVLAIPPTRRPAAARGLSGGAVVIAVVTLLSALELEHRAQPRGLAVLRGSTPLLEDPSPAGASIGTAAIGEVGQIDAREGQWLRISLDGTRAGWIRSAAIIPLDSPSPVD